MTELLLLRHGKPEAVSGTAIADPPLTEEGREQARRAAEALTDGRYGAVTAVVSSTMLRAVQTAQPLVAALGVAAQTDSRLVELDHEWTTYGMGFDGYASRGAAYAALNRGTWGADTFDPVAFRTRVRDGLDAVVAGHPDETVAVVCHGGVINAYLAHVLGVDQMMFFAPGYCSLSRVLAEPDGYRELLTANETLRL